MFYFVHLVENVGVINITFRRTLLLYSTNCFVKKYVDDASSFTLFRDYFVFAVQERYPACKKFGCWFVGGGNLHEALHTL